MKRSESKYSLVACILLFILWYSAADQSIIWSHALYCLFCYEAQWIEILIGRMHFIVYFAMKRSGLKYSLVACTLLFILRWNAADRSILWSHALYCLFSCSYARTYFFALGNRYPHLLVNWILHLGSDHWTLSNRISNPIRPVIATIVKW